MKTKAKPLRPMVVYKGPTGRYFGIHRTYDGHNTEVVGPTFSGFKTAKAARRAALDLGFEPINNV